MRIVNSFILQLPDDAAGARAHQRAADRETFNATAEDSLALSADSLLLRGESIDGLDEERQAKVNRLAQAYDSGLLRADADATAQAVVWRGFDRIANE